MFLRKKINKSGSVSVQIVDKQNGYKVVKTVGSTIDADQLKKLVQQGETIINTAAPNQLKLLSDLSSWEISIKNFLENLHNSQIHTVGPELIFGKLFDQIGFN